MRARRIFDFGEKCAFVAAPNLDQVAAWPPEGILAWWRRASHTPGEATLRAGWRGRAASKELLNAIVRGG